MSIDSSILETEFYKDWGKLLVESYSAILERPLVSASSQGSNSQSYIATLFDAPFALVSHGVEDDPIFNFANKTALDLFELGWDEFTQLPSRKSAEVIEQQERARLLAEVTKYGYIANYSGVRISGTGRRFVIDQAVVWNVVDSNAKHHGQAAMFSKWRYL